MNAFVSSDRLLEACSDPTEEVHEVVRMKSCVRINGVLISLAPMEYVAFEALLARNGEMATIDDIQRDMYGTATKKGSAFVHLCTLRKKLSACPAFAKCFETLRLPGTNTYRYRLSAQIVFKEPEPAKEFQLDSEYTLSLREDGSICLNDIVLELQKASREMLETLAESIGEPVPRARIQAHLPANSKSADVQMHKLRKAFEAVNPNARNLLQTKKLHFRLGSPKAA